MISNPADLFLANCSVIVFVIGLAADLPIQIDMC